MTPRQRIDRCRVIAIVRSPRLTPDVAVAVVDRLATAGLDVIEFTLNSADALRAIEAASRRFDGQAAIGAGTVRTADDVRRVADAGAQFAVSPDTAPEVIRATVSAGLLSAPGAFTPTDIAIAQRHGADVVKLFPAMPAGPTHLRCLRGPFDDVAFVPTGGIGLDDIGPFLTAGAAAVGLGSVLVDGHDPLHDLDERAQAVAETVAGATA